ncbi:DUF1285 domain-containing protein [Psychrosphaera aestuarii]|uniref:DUF1285 domain-containing protein n=1 Tax=Psychrosphaera aestuarii TaxID=1266052 RepID=UPI001B33FC2D|nr:DUF1285 domain-containing protein [Psychrosphaera aestuarii]
MDLQKLTQQLDDLSQSPPFEKWNPPFCGDIDMEIKKDGRWFYMGSPIGRIKLVKLFASVLLKENNEYFLKTPAEKIRIQVEDAPFVVTEWEVKNTNEGDAILVTTNIGQQVVLGELHPLINETGDGENAEPKLYVELNRGLRARVHRNVFYQWVSDQDSPVYEQKGQLFLRSGEQNFLLG